MHLDIKQVADLLRGDVIGRNRVLCPGPGHSARDRSLSVTFHTDGFLTNSFAGDDFRDCRDHVQALLGWGDEPKPIDSRKAVTVATGDPTAKIRTAGRLWDSGVSIAGTLAETYLASRSLTYDGDALRYRPADRTMVARMVDPLSGDPLGCHRTFLDSTGQKTHRLMYGPLGVVPLLKGEGELGIAEGIETALATGHSPLWACLTAVGIKRFPVLPDVQSLIIFADNDANGAGQNAAVECAERWHAAGREVTIRMPADVGQDYADGRAA